MNSKKSKPIILGYFYISITIFIVLLNKTLSKIIINGILKVFSLFISPIGIGIICLGLIITLLIRKKKMQSQRYKKRHILLIILLILFSLISCALGLLSYLN